MKKKELKALQSKEAMVRIEALTKQFQLNPHILDYYKKGLVYYSYIWAMYLGSIDTVKYDPRYTKVIADFEARTQSSVYHAIEFGKSSEYFALLSVSSNPENWPNERLKGDHIQTYIHNFENPDYSKELMLAVDGYNEFGCLIAKEYAFEEAGYRTYGHYDGVQVIMI